jgi:hypothetical protein
VLSDPISGPLAGTGAAQTTSSGLMATGEPSGRVNHTDDMKSPVLRGWPGDSEINC